MEPIYADLKPLGSILSVEKQQETFVAFMLGSGEGLVGPNKAASSITDLAALLKTCDVR
jgi:hypothetical protein